MSEKMVSPKPTPSEPKPDQENIPSIEKPREPDAAEREGNGMAQLEHAFNTSLTQLQRIAARVFVQRVEHHADHPEKSAEQSSLSAVELKNLRDQEADAAHHSIRLSEKLLNQLSHTSQKFQELKFQSIEDIQRCNAVLTEAVSLADQVQTTWDAFESITQKARQLHHDYVSASLKEEGYQTFDDLYGKTSAVSQEMYTLNRQSRQLEQVYRIPLVGRALSRWVNKEKIEANTRKAAELQKTYQHLQQLERLGTEYLSLPWISSTHREQLKQATTQLSVSVIDAIQAYYENQIQSSPDETKTIPAFELNETLLDDLNDDFINRHVKTSIEEERQRYRDLINRGYHYQKKLADISDEGNIQRAFQLIKRAFQGEYFGSWSTSDEERTRKEHLMQQFLRDLNQLEQDAPDLAAIVQQQYMYQHHGRPLNDHYQKLISLLTHPALSSQKAAIEASYCKTLKKLDQSVGLSGGYTPTELWNKKNEIRERLGNHEQLSLENIVAGFIQNFDIHRWVVFRENETIKRVFGDRLQQTDRLLAHGIATRLFQSRGADERTRYTKLLLNFHYPDVVPMLMFGAYLNEETFIPSYTPGESTAVYQYLQSLTPQDLKALEALHVPGLAEAIGLIREHPTEFHTQQALDQQPQAHRQSPLPKTIKRHLINTAFHYLKSEEEAPKQLVTDVLAETIPHVGEGYTLLEEHLQKSRTQDEKRQILDCVKKMAVEKKDVSAADILIRHYPTLEEELKQSVDADAAKIFGCFVGNQELPTSTAEVLGDMLHIKPNEVQQTVSFVTELQKLPYAFAYDPTLFHGYREHSSLKDATVAEIKEIQELVPTFHYRIITKNTYNPQTGLDEQRYIADPYEVAIETIPLQKILQQLYHVQLEQSSFPQKFSDHLLRVYQTKGPTPEESVAFAPTEQTNQRKQFHEGLSIFVRQLYEPEGKLHPHQAFFENSPWLQFFARDPERMEKIPDLPNAMSDFFETAPSIPKLKSFLLNHLEALGPLFFEKGGFRRLKNQLTQEVCLSFLYQGEENHDALEELFDNGWITIQTYNRLYGARRRFIGFQTYAYRPQAGEFHPTINVTFYGAPLGEENGNLTVSSITDAQQFLDGHIRSTGGQGTPFRIYPETYAVYQKALQRYQSLGTKERQRWLENFSWWDPPKRYPDADSSLLVNTALPFGVAANGHTHFYMTPYGLISGCVAVNPQESGILEKDHPAAKGADNITGHKEMLLDFLKKQTRSAETLPTTTQSLPTGTISIQFEHVDLPLQLQELTLPGNLSLAEVLLNLHFEQYFHGDNIVPTQELLQKLRTGLETGAIVAYQGERQLKAEDAVAANTPLIFTTPAQAIDLERAA